MLKGPKAAQADVRVDVYNGGGPQGSAQETLAWLQNSQGMRLKSTNKGNAPAKVAKTTLEYAPNQADQARTLAGCDGAARRGAEAGNEGRRRARGDDTDPRPDFKGAGVPITGPAKAPEGVQKVEADKQVCAK